MKKIGFIGLGMMGGPMAANLLKAGFELTGYDARRERTDALAEQGATAAGGLAELGMCDAVIVMVNTDAQAREVVAALIPQLRPRSVPILCMSTVLPSTIRELGQRAGREGIALLDAPVSGGPIVAQLGALAIMVGGERELFERARPAFEAMGRMVAHVGPLGAGLGVKLVNNMIGITTLPIVVEALRLGLAQGLELQTMIDVIKASSGNTWVTDQWDQARLFLGFLLNDPTQLESLLTTGLKDLKLAGALCDESGFDAPRLRDATRVFEQQDPDALRQQLDDIMQAAGSGSST